VGAVEQRGAHAYRASDRNRQKSGERDSGPFEGTVTVQTLPVAGWFVGDIQCVGPRPGDFHINIPDGTVTMQHALHDDQTCSFTHRRQSTARPRAHADPLGRHLLVPGIQSSCWAPERRS
jgi:hypothetical protein